MKDKNPFFQKKVKAIEVNKPPIPEYQAILASQKTELPIRAGYKSISQLLKEMEDTGFQGRKLGEAAAVWERMLKDKDLTIVLGYAGSLSTTGQWKIINWLMENRFIDVLVSTGANISEDIVEAMGASYWKGDHLADDNALFTAEINRYYDVYGYEPDYGRMTDLIVDCIKNLDPKHPYSTREFLTELGKFLSGKGINSIVAQAYLSKVPVFSPALVDSAYGEAILLAKNKGFDLILDQAKDFKEFMGLAEKIKRTGVIYVGGGVPKDFIQLIAVSSALAYPERKIPGREDGRFRGSDPYHYYPHQYAIQFTGDDPKWGGLSGCTFDEATSWGKEVKAANDVQCFCDATIALPIVTHALNERIDFKREVIDYFKK